MGDNTILVFDQDIRHNKLPKHKTLIGSGGAGDVFIDSEDSSFVYKISHKAAVCKSWNYESKIYEKIQKNNINTKSVKVIKFLRYFIAKREESKCVLVLQRVLNPLNKNFTIHALIGEKDYVLKDKRRGHFYGSDKLKELGLVDDKLLRTFMKELGIVLGKLHFLIKNDAYDIEVWIGTTKSDNTVKLYIGDFDLSRMFEEFSDEVVNRIVEGMFALPYFPIEDVNKQHFDIFSNAYIKIGKKYGFEKMAESIIEEYKFSTNL